MHQQKHSAFNEGGDRALICTDEATLRNIKFSSSTRLKRASTDCSEQKCK